MMSYLDASYYPEDYRLYCPGKMLEFDFIVAYLFMPIAAGRIMLDIQRQARLRPENWLIVAPEAETYMPQHCVDGEPPPWRRTIRETTGKLSFFAPVAIPPLAAMLIAHRCIQRQRRQAGHIYNDVCVQLATQHGLMRPSRNVFLMSGLRHDWFVVWAGLVKKYDMHSENREQEESNVERCRYFSEEEARITTMIGGREAALSMAKQIVEAIEINFNRRG